MDLQIYTFTFVRAFAVLTVAGQAIALGVLLVLVLSWVKGRSSAVLDWVASHGLLLMLIVSVVATLGSLFLSEIAGWNPCKFCWLQRIFMYPQVIMLLIALWKRDRGIAAYILPLCAIGLLYASYHYYIQMYDIVAAPTNPATPCDASGESCVKTPFVHFGYITIPLMAWTAFLLNMVGSVVVMKKRV